MSESNGDKNNAETSNQDDEYNKRLEASRIKFDENYLEFKTKSIREIPCFRSTFLTSIPAGIFTGLAAYLYNGRARKSSNYAMASFLIVTAGMFITCRREFDKKVAANKELGEIMKLIIKYRGTELEEQFQKKYNEKLQELDPKSKFV